MRASEFLFGFPSKGKERRGDKDVQHSSELLYKVKDRMIDDGSEDVYRTRPSPRRSALTLEEWRILHL